MALDLYFSQYFEVDPQVLEDYGAFDISVVSDLPLFVDPFLLFNSENPEYQQLHEEILRYLRFLRDQATPHLDPGLIDTWYRFKEVKQNWLGFTSVRQRRRRPWARTSPRRCTARSARSSPTSATRRSHAGRTWRSCA